MRPSAASSWALSRSHTDALEAMAERFEVQAAVGCEAAKAADAEARALLECPTRGLPPPAVRIDTTAHVKASQSDADCEAACLQLEEMLAGEPMYERFAQRGNRALLRRFLTARGNDPEKAKKLLLGALEWREQRLPSRLDYDELEREARTGKMRVTGLDAHGRSVVVFDGSAQNTRDPHAHLRFIAFNLEHAAQRMEGTGVEKYVIFLHLSNFYLSNCPPRAFLKDACNLLSSCFPERCGNIIFHQAPRMFSGMYRLISPFVDPRTAAKFVFISGDDSPGSAHDATLRELLGARWRTLTGVGQPQESPNSSPGYRHERDWGAMMSHELAWARQAAELQQARQDGPREQSGKAQESSDRSTDVGVSSADSMRASASTEDCFSMLDSDCSDDSSQVWPPLRVTGDRAASRAEENSEPCSPGHTQSNRGTALQVDDGQSGIISPLMPLSPASAPGQDRAMLAAAEKAVAEATEAAKAAASAAKAAAAAAKDSARAAAEAVQSSNATRQLLDARLSSPAAARSISPISFLLRVLSAWKVGLAASAGAGLPLLLHSLLRSSKAPPPQALQLIAAGVCACLAQATISKHDA